VGYKLLRKAGWQEGTGLGATEQGRLVPIVPVQQQGKKGIGKDRRQHSFAEGNRQRQDKQESKPHPKDLPVPLVLEDPEVKRKRHQQALQAEADQQAEKELARFMYRQFNEFTGPTSDSNPLLRPNKLTRTNPLL
jgi:predicted ATP-dependent protease